MIKVRKWELALIKGVGLPLLRRLCEALEEVVAKTPTRFDDALVGALKAVIDFLEQDDVFTVT